MSAGEKYAAAAYLVVLLFVVAWVLIISTKLVRLRGEAEQLLARVRRRGDG